MVKKTLDIKTHPLFGLSLIEASAGTGKTFTITHLYVRYLLETELTVDQILVVTFTNAATQELTGRIRKLIYQVWTYLNDPNIKDNYLESLFSGYRRDQNAMFKLQRALINFDEAAIYSIHGFCQRVLNRFPLETHSLIQQQIIPDEIQIETSAIQDYWRKFIAGLELDRLRWILDIWDHPNKLLQDVRPLMGFDSKLTQLSRSSDSASQLERLQRIWKELIKNWEKDADLLRAILVESPALKRNLIRKPSVEQLFEQLPTLFDKGVVPHTLPKNWPLVTATKLNQSLKKDALEPSLSHSFFTYADSFQKQHQEWLNQLKIDTVVDAALFLQSTVEASKRKAQNISFNDLVRKVSDVVKHDNPWLVDKISELYPVAMVDEFQDTDQRQYQIFKTLYQNRDGMGLIMIGDPKQAIYSFRGADVFTYQQARAATKSQFTLDANYRSSADYINMVNTLFLQNRQAFVFDQLIDFHPVSAGKDQNILTQDDQNLTPLVSWLYPETDVALSKALATEYFTQVCAQEIHSILHQKNLKLGGETVQAGDLAVLVKTGYQAGLIKNKLAELGISSALVLRDSVFASEQARDISLLLDVLIEPSNTGRLCGLLSTDLFGWNAAEIGQLQQDSQQLVDVLEQMNAYQQHWQDRGILSMFFSLLDEQGSLQKNLSQLDGERRVTNWLHIVELLQQQAGQHASLSEALQWLLLQRRDSDKMNDNEEHQLRLESDSELVRIVTIHKSKGLEYPIVFLPFMWDMPSMKNQPQSYSVHDEQGNKKLMVYDEAERERWLLESQAEQVRLFYVAMTRAKYRCYLGWGHIRGAGSSAIATCLYPDMIDNGKYPYDLLVTDPASLRKPFEQLNQQQHLVDIIYVDTEKAPQSQVVKGINVRTKARTFARTLQQQWRISSYSQLASSGHVNQFDRPDYDALKEISIQDEDAIDHEQSRYSFPKGARAGSFLHDILEHQPFDRSIDRDLITVKCQEYGYELDWIPVIEAWIKEVLQCQLKDFSLSQISASQKVCEMEFYMTSNGLSAESLNQFLLENHYRKSSQLFSFSRLNGFLKGFIDLVFEHKEQYYIADYKSNFLGNSPQLYDFEHCQAAMYEHHYHLQYLIYTLALHRFLRWRVENYDYDRHFGGVFYLFLRGMSSADKQRNGVFFHRPERSVIERLESMFNE